MTPAVRLTTPISCKSHDAGQAHLLRAPGVSEACLSISQFDQVESIGVTTTTYTTYLMTEEGYFLGNVGYDAPGQLSLRAVMQALADQMKAHTQSRASHVMARRLTVAQADTVRHIAHR